MGARRSRLTSSRDTSSADVGGTELGVQGAGGNVDFNSAVVLLGSRTISTGATAGNITFDSTVRATTAFTETLGLRTSTGTISFNGTMGDNDKRLGDETVTSAGTVRVEM